MKRFWRAAVTFALVAGVFIGGWVYVNRQRLADQWASYHVGAAARYDEARERIARIERGDRAEGRLRELVAKWGTGNRRFDEYLARYVTDPASSRRLRELFSRHLSSRPTLLSPWAHFWAHQASLEPREQIASYVTYLDEVAHADNGRAARRLTWREVLDLQAIFTLTGARDRAARLEPDNWRELFRVWQETAPTEPPPIERPTEPWPDDYGPSGRGWDMRKSRGPRVV